jgi:hypothetical protein
LTEQQQLDVLIKSLHSKEDDIFDSLFKKLSAIETAKLSGNDIHRLAKLLQFSGGLDHKNVQRLRSELQAKISDDTPINWEDLDEIERHLKIIFLFDSSDKEIAAEIVTLGRLARSKLFFQKQVGLPEEMTLIPRWFHATRRQNLVGILNSGEIQVRHENLYKGVWVSSKREPHGPYVLAMSNRIVKIDPQPYTRDYLEFKDKRWRGLQKNVQIQAEDQKPSLVFIGVKTQTDKTAQKADKQEIVQILKNRGFADPNAFSVDQLDFMQKHFLEILGVPNLPIYGGAKEKSIQIIKLN